MEQPAATVSSAPLGPALIGRLKDAIPGSERALFERVTVVTPSVHSSFYLRRAVAGGGLFNVSFTRLEDLAEALDPGGDGGSPLSRLLAGEIVYASAQEAPFSGRLGNLRGHGAFHAALHRSFRDLDTAPDEVVARVEGAGSDVAGEIARAWRIYRRRRETFADRALVARRAAEAVRSGHRKLSGLGRIVFFLAEPPPRQYRPLFDALLERRDVSVVVGLTGDEQGNSLLGLAGLDAGREPVEGGPPASAVETHLVSAPDRAVEVRWVVRNVAHLATEQGVRLSRIAVFYADESYGPRVDEALRVAGIPVAGPQPAALSQQPEGRFLVLLLDALEGDFARDAVMAWLAGTPVKSPDPAVPVNAARWDAVSRNAGVTRGRELWRDRLAAYARGRLHRADEGERAGELSAEEAAGHRAAAGYAEALARFVEGLARDGEPPPDGSPWAAFALWARRLVDRYLETTDLERRERLLAVLDPLGELDIVGGPKPAFERFAPLLREELDQSAGKGGPLGVGVFVAPLVAATGTDFDAVHILGMTEGSFPPRDVEDPLLPDWVRRRADPEGAALPQRTQRRALARRRYLAALAAGRKRFLLWPRSEMGATRGLGPARWYLEEAVRLGREPVAADGLSGLRGRPWFEWLDAPEDEHAALDESRLADEHDYDLRAVSSWRAAGRRLGDLFVASEAGSPLAAALRLESAREGDGWSAWDGNLGGAGRVPAVPATAVSPTALETWARCPFRYFAGHVLSLEPVERPEDVLTISPMDRGLLIHAVLERFTRARSEEHLDPTAPDERARRLMLVVLEEEFRRVEQRGVGGKRALWRAEKERIRRLLLDRYLKREASRVEKTGLLPRATELTFGLPGSRCAPVTMDLADGASVRFRGRVDRVEVSEDGRTAAVVDYKTGRSDDYRRIGEDPVDRGRLLQLPVYAMAAREWLGGDAAVRGDYWFVSEREGFRTLGLSLAEAETPLRRAVASIIRGMRSGVFPAVPGRPFAEGYENCAFCPFDALCPAARERQWERKRGEGALAPFTSLAGPGGDVEAGR